MSKNKCIYHVSDDDGRLSAILTSKFYNGNIDLIGMSNYYADKIDIQTLNMKLNEQETENVIICDITLNEKAMLYLYERYNLIWIDHHKNNIENILKEKSDKISGLRQDGIAASRLTWDYFFSGRENILNTDEFYFNKNKIPKLVDLVSKYDVFDFIPDTDSEYENFHYGCDLYDMTIFNDENITFWNKLLSNEDEIINKIIKEGKIIGRFLKSKNIKDSNYYGCDIEIDNKIFLVLNRISNPNLLVYHINDKYDGVITYHRNKKHWKCSIRTRKDNIDVSKIAKKFGGGGHQKASGFSLEDNEIHKLIKGDYYDNNE